MTRLLSAIRGRDAAEVRELLEHGADANEVDAWGNTPLLTALVSNLESAPDSQDIEDSGMCEEFSDWLVSWEETTDALLSAGARVCVSDRDGRTPLHLLVQHGSTPLVQRVLAAGAHVNATDARGMTPLHYAFSTPRVMLHATKSREELTEILVRAGADVNAPDTLGRTPLHMAILCGGVNDACISQLLYAGANPNASCKFGTPLHCVVYCGHSYTTVRLLTSFGADVNACDAKLGTPLLQASRVGRLIEELVARGAHVNVCDHVGNTPLHYAVRHDCPTAMKRLLDAGASVHVLNAMGHTPLSYSPSSERIVRILIDAEAQVHRPVFMRAVMATPSVCAHSLTHDASWTP